MRRLVLVLWVAASGFVCLGWDLVLICLVLFVGCSSLRWLVGFVVLVCCVFCVLMYFGICCGC